MLLAEIGSDVVIKNAKRVRLPNTQDVAQFTQTLRHRGGAGGSFDVSTNLHPRYPAQPRIVKRNEGIDQYFYKAGHLLNRLFIASDVIHGGVSLDRYRNAVHGTLWRFRGGEVPL